MVSLETWYIIKMLIYCAHSGKIASNQDPEAPTKLSVPQGPQINPITSTQHEFHQPENKRFPFHNYHLSCF